MRSMSTNVMRLSIGTEARKRPGASAFREGRPRVRTRHRYARRPPRERAVDITMPCSVAGPRAPLRSRSRRSGCADPSPGFTRAGCERRAGSDAAARDRRRTQLRTESRYPSAVTSSSVPSSSAGPTCSPTRGARRRARRARGSSDRPRYSELAVTNDVKAGDVERGLVHPESTRSARIRAVREAHRVPTGALALVHPVAVPRGRGGSRRLAPSSLSLHEA